MPRLNSRTKRPIKPKIGSVEAHDTGYRFKVKRSRSPGPFVLTQQMCPIFQMGRPPIRTSNFVHGRSTKAHTTDKRRDIQGQGSRPRGNVVCLCLTFKRVHESPGSWPSMLPLLGSLGLSVLDLGRGTGQTDGQTMAIDAY